MMPETRSRSRNLGRIRGRLEGANDLAVRTNPFFVEGEDLLHADDVLFHSGDLSDAGDLARSVAHAGGLHDDGDGRRDLLPHGLLRQVHVAHGDHRLQTG